MRINANQFRSILINEDIHVCTSLRIYAGSEAERISDQHRKFEIYRSA